MNDELMNIIFGFEVGFFCALAIILSVEGCETVKQTENINCHCECCLESEAEP